MKSKVLILVAVFSLIAFWNAPAEETKANAPGANPAPQETKPNAPEANANAEEQANPNETKLNVEATAIGQFLDFEGQKAKFNEYRDIRTGPTGQFEVQYERKAYYLDLSGYDIGRNDQRYGLFGGQWGSFRYEFKYDEIPHNLTENARTFYSGVGGSSLTYTPQPPSTFLPNRDVSTWNTFDYSIERRNYGGGFKLDMFKPFFFGISAVREERAGVIPIGAAGTSPGGISIELPAPVNYLTDTIRVEAGYIKNPLSLMLHYTYGQFENKNELLDFRDPATFNTAATTDTVTRPPDNDYFKFDFTGGVKLPYNTKFDANASYARNESSAALLNSYVSDVSAAASNIGQQGRTGILLSNPLFNGRVDIQNYNFVLTTKPIYFLDAKIFYKYYQTSNKSDSITTTDPGPTPLGVTPTVRNNADRLFDYSTHKYGAQVGFKLPMSFYAIAGYTGGETSRKRPDIPSYHDDLYTAEVRWSGVDWMVARAGYERLHRRADFHAPDATGPSDPTLIENYIQRFDAASKESTTWRASVDFFPVPDLTLSIGYRWKNVPYPDTVLGLHSLRSDEWHVDADYLILKRVRLFAYFDYEYVKTDQQQRTFTSGATANPALEPTATDFNWTVTETSRNYAYGVGTDIYAIPKKLTLKLQYTYIKSQGFADYTYLLGLNPIPPTRTQDNIDISNLDNYTLDYFLAKATYQPFKLLSLSFGYAYERYKYDDAQLNGYQYVPMSATGGLLGFLTGAYANQNYRANIFFLTASYLF